MPRSKPTAQPGATDPNGTGVTVAAPPPPPQFSPPPQLSRAQAIARLTMKRVSATQRRSRQATPPLPPGAPSDSDSDSESEPLAARPAPAVPLAVPPPEMPAAAGGLWLGGRVPAAAPPKAPPKHLPKPAVPEAAAPPGPPKPGPRRACGVYSRSLHEASEEHRLAKPPPLAGRSAARTAARATRRVASQAGAASMGGETAAGPQTCPQTCPQTAPSAATPEGPVRVPSFGRRAGVPTNVPAPLASSPLGPSPELPVIAVASNAPAAVQPMAANVPPRERPKHGRRASVRWPKEGEMGQGGNQGGS